MNSDDTVVASVAGLATTGTSVAGFSITRASVAGFATAVLLLFFERAPNAIPAMASTTIATTPITSPLDIDLF